MGTWMVFSMSNLSGTSGPGITVRIWFCNGHECNAKKDGSPLSDSPSSASSWFVLLENTLVMVVPRQLQLLCGHKRRIALVVALDMRNGSTLHSSDHSGDRTFLSYPARLVQISIKRWYVPPFHYLAVNGEVEPTDMVCCNVNCRKTS